MSIERNVSGGRPDRRPLHVQVARWITGARRIDNLTDKVEALRREVHMLMRQQQAQLPDDWRRGMAALGDAPADNVFPSSTLCRQEIFEQPFFAYWADRIGFPKEYHRKNWEYAFVAQALWERGVIRPGARGLGFGVGREPLAAAFASEDCEIVATDLAFEASASRGWSATQQHAAGLANLRYDNVCPRDRFDRNVSFRTCDMNAVPKDLTGFDFCWSACAFEHLGSIENGLAFVERSIDCLNPGGWAVHTTEFNVSSNLDTVDQGGTVLFRRRDLEELARRLEAAGHRVAPLDFSPGSALLDGVIDVPPYTSEPHLKLAIAGYAATSFGIIVQKAG